MPAEDGNGPELCQEEIVPILGKNSFLWPVFSLENAVSLMFPYTSSENSVLKNFKIHKPDFCLLVGKVNDWLQSPIPWLGENNCGALWLWAAHSWLLYITDIMPCSATNRWKFCLVKISPGYSLYISLLCYLSSWIYQNDHYLECHTCIWLDCLMNNCRYETVSLKGCWHLSFHPWKSCKKWMNVDVAVDMGLFSRTKLYAQCSRKTMISNYWLLECEVIKLLLWKNLFILEKCILGQK